MEGVAPNNILLGKNLSNEAKQFPSPNQAHRKDNQKTLSPETQQPSGVITIKLNKMAKRHNIFGKLSFFSKTSKLYGKHNGKYIFSKHKLYI